MRFYKIYARGVHIVPQEAERCDVMHCDVVQLVVDRSSSSSLCGVHSVTSGHWIDTCTGRNTASHPSITQITRIQAEKTNACRPTSVEKAKVGLLTD